MRFTAYMLALALPIGDVLQAITTTQETTMLRQKRTNYARYMQFLKDHDQDARNAHRPCPSMTREQADQSLAENDISRSEWTRLREAFETKKGHVPSGTWPLLASSKSGSVSQAPEGEQATWPASRDGAADEGA